jgi:hypothetical protein
MDGSNNLLRAYTGQILNELNKWYNITITVDATLASSAKVKFFVNGLLVSSTIISSLNAPNDIALSSGYSGVSTLDPFSRYYYKISSMDKYQFESAASDNKSIQIGNNAAFSSVLIKWEGVANSNGYKIYRSTSSVFEANSLLATVSGSETTIFWDRGTSVVAGSPPVTSESKYSDAITSFYDGNDMALSLGSAPIKNNTDNNYFEGQIHMLHIYKTNLSSSQINRNFEINKKKFSSIGLVGTGERAATTSSALASGASAAVY